MAASVRNSLVTTQTTGDAGGTMTVPVPAGLADTDILFVWCSTRGNTQVSPVPETGWSMIVNDVHRSNALGNDARVTVWRKVISGAPPVSHVFQTRSASTELAVTAFVTYVSVAVQLGNTSDPEDLISTTTTVGGTAQADLDTNTSVIMPEVDPSTVADRLVLTGGDFNALGLQTATYLTVTGLTLVAQGTASTNVAGAVYSKSITTETIEGPWTADIDQTVATLGRFAAASVLVNSASVPDAPVIGTATAGENSASVAFTPPVSDGGSLITGYRATSTPGGITATGASSPIVVPGLTAGVGYTFTVAATNSLGYGSESAASNSATPTIPAPTADAGPDQTVEPGELVTLTAAGSSTTGSVTYAWTQTLGTATAILRDSTTSTPDFYAPQGPDALTFQVTVTDDGGSDTDTVVVTLGTPASGGLPVRTRLSGAWV